LLRQAFWYLGGGFQIRSNFFCFLQNTSPLSWALVGLTLSEKSHPCFIFEFFLLLLVALWGLDNLFRHNMVCKKEKTLKIGFFLTCFII
jgi:hypothetical protein